MIEEVGFSKRCGERVVSLLGDQPLCLCVNATVEGVVGEGIMNGRRSEIVRGNQRWEPVSIARNLHEDHIGDVGFVVPSHGVTHTMARIHAGVVFSDGNMHQGRVWASSKGTVDVLVAGVCEAAQGRQQGLQWPIHGPWPRGTIMAMPAPRLCPPT